MSASVLSSSPPLSRLDFLVGLPDRCQGVTRGEGTSPLVAVPPCDSSFVGRRNASFVRRQQIPELSCRRAVTRSKAWRSSQGEDIQGDPYTISCDCLRALSGPCAQGAVQGPTRIVGALVPDALIIRAAMAQSGEEQSIAQIQSEVQEHMEVAEELNDRLRRLRQRYPDDPAVAHAFALSNIDVENHNDQVIKQAIHLAWEKGGIRALRNPRSRLNQLVREEGLLADDEPQIA